LTGGRQGILSIAPNSDVRVKSLKIPFLVIPAKAGIQFFQGINNILDSGFHRSDAFLRGHQFLVCENLDF
jgi:hypothetical protein